MRRNAPPSTGLVVTLSVLSVAFLVAIVLGVLGTIAFSEIPSSGLVPFTVNPNISVNATNTSKRWGNMIDISIIIVLDVNITGDSIVFLGSIPTHFSHRDRSPVTGLSLNDQISTIIFASLDTEGLITALDVGGGNVEAGSSLQIHLVYMM